MSKKSKKTKEWEREKNHIQKEKQKPMLERIYGNIKDKCYTCPLAGLYFNYEKLRYEPFCTNNQHYGKLCNFSIDKWNDKFEERQKNWVNRQENGNPTDYKDVIMYKKSFNIWKKLKSNRGNGGNIL